MSVIFVHIPRTGGTNLSWSLRDSEAFYPSPTHLYLENLPNWEKADHIFTVVRNPFDRLASLYRFIVIGYEKNIEWTFPYITELEIYSFEFFWETIKEHANKTNFKGPVDKAHIYNLAKPQCHWLHPSIEHIGRTEKLYKTMKLVASWLNIKPILKHSPPQIKKEHHYRNLYTSKLRKEVTKFYQEDITRFDYCF